MKAWVSVLLYRDDGSFSDYVSPQVELSRVPEVGDVLNLAVLKLKAWAVGAALELNPWSVGSTGKESPEIEWVVICRILPGEVNRLTAQRKLLSCGFRCDSRARRRK